MAGGELVNRREARAIALLHCALLVDQQLSSHFGFLESDNESDLLKVEGEARRIRDRLFQMAAALREPTP